MSDNIEIKFYATLGIDDSDDSDGMDEPPPLLDLDAVSGGTRKRSLTDDSDENTNKKARTVSKMASDRDDAVLLGLLVQKINDYEPNLVKTIQAIVDLLRAAEQRAAKQHFETVFGKSLESFVKGGNLYLNGICNTEEKLKAVARVLAANVEIEGWNGMLILRNNQIFDIDAIGKALETNNTLNVLNLNNNEIVNIDSIGKALGTNNTLEKLHLSGNQIVDIDAIGKALETNNTLNVLTLNYNQIVNANKQKLNRGTRTRAKSRHSGTLLITT